VTVLRSPSSLSAADASETRIGASLDFLAEPPEASPSGAPQSSQNLAVAELSAPHLVHRFDIGLPHSGQNFLPDVLTVRHLEQRIEPRIRASTTHGCYIRPRVWKSPPKRAGLTLLGPQVPCRQGLRNPFMLAKRTAFPIAGYLGDSHGRRLKKGLAMLHLLTAKTPP
jgi:hypothetical protein